MDACMCICQSKREPFDHRKRSHCAYADTLFAYRKGSHLLRKRTPVVRLSPFLAADFPLATMVSAPSSRRCSASHPR